MHAAHRCKRYGCSLIGGAPFATACLDVQLKQKARGGMGGASVMDETTSQGNMGQGFGQGFDDSGSGAGKQFLNWRT